MSRFTAGLILIFTCFIIFEVAIYASMEEKLSEFEQAIIIIKSDVKEVQKTQRLVAQDAEKTMRFVIESGVTNDKN